MTDTQNRKTISKIFYEIKKLSAEDSSLINKFHCADSYPEKGLEDFLKNDAFEEMENGDGTTYLIINKAENDLFGFFTIEASALPYFYNDPDDDNYSHILCGISAIKLSCFAVDKQYQDVFYQDKPIAAWLIEAIISMIYDMSTSSLGAKAIYLRPLPSAKKFYLQNHFLLNDFYQTFASADDDLEVMLIMLHRVCGITE